MELPPPGLGVTGLTEGAKVGFIMRTAAIKRENVMDFLGRDETVGLQAIFAQRVLGNVTVADEFPTMTVGFVWVLSAGMFIIFAGGNGLMGRAITLGRERVTAGISAGFRRFSGHGRDLQVRYIM